VGREVWGDPRPWGRAGAISRPLRREGEGKTESQRCYTAEGLENYRKTPVKQAVFTWDNTVSSIFSPHPLSSLPDKSLVCHPLPRKGSL